jgi:putative FmdB family regulatory protein
LHRRAGVFPRIAIANGLRRCHLLFPIQISAKRTIMPIYAYRCDACGHGRDVLQKMSDAPLTDCPSCGAAGSFKKQLTAAGFQLKGSGWYVTDFRGGNSGNKGASAPAATGGAAASAPAASGGDASGSSASSSSTSTSTSSTPSAPAGGSASA